MSKSRNPLPLYFADLWAGIATTCQGMALTLRYFFAPKITMKYPEERPVIPKSHRGLHAYDEAKCILCNMCVNTCPVSCITLESEGRGKDGLVKGYSVDYGKCLFCNLCAEVCPTQCVWLTQYYSLPRATRAEVVLQFAKPKTEADVAAWREAAALKDAEKKAAASKAAAEKATAEKQAELGAGGPVPEKAG
jgi:NADH-quinone oxidoreductase subunit I